MKTRKFTIQEYLRNMSSPSFIKLSELAAKIEGVIRQTIGAEQHWIVAEISGHAFYAKSNRHYFEFIEKNENSADPVAKFKGIAWAAGDASIQAFTAATGQVFTNGIQVLAKVKVEFSGAYGMQLILIEVDASFTLGNMERQRRETLDRLVKENAEFISKKGEEYLTKNKSAEWGKVIQRIAVIGSPNSNGYADFEHTLQRNNFGYKFHVDIYQSSVQGELAGREIVDCLKRIYTSEIPYDTVVLIRGGGAKTDFIVFDQYGLSRAVAKFPIPIITGLGHHKDVSIVDMMAHTSMKTPTKAAEFILACNRHFEEQIIQFENRIIINTQQLLRDANSDLERLRSSLAQNSMQGLNDFSKKIIEFHNVLQRGALRMLSQRNLELVQQQNTISNRSQMVIKSKRDQLKVSQEAIGKSSLQLIQNTQRSLINFEAILRILSPENTLRRGYALVSAGGKIITDTKMLDVGETISIQTHQHELEATITSKKNRDERT